MQLKNFLEFEKDNINAEGRNGFRRDGFFQYFSINTRRHLTNSNEVHEGKFIRRDNKVNRFIISSLTSIRRQDQLQAGLERTHRLFSKNFHDEDGDDISPDAKNKRYESFVNTGLLSGRLLNEVESTYEANKVNSGNTSGNNRSASIQEVRENNVNIGDLVQSGGYFWVQAKGKAGQDLNDKSQPFSQPAVGTLMAYGRKYEYNIDGNEVVRQIRYMTEPRAVFLPGITYSALLNRFKPNFVAKDATGYPNHRCRLVHLNYKYGQYQEKQTVKGKPKEEAEHNLLLCYIDWKVGKGPE